MKRCPACGHHNYREYVDPDPRTPVVDIDGPRHPPACLRCGTKI